METKGLLYNDFPKSMKILIVADVDIASASILSERFVPHDPIFDFILACGPFHSSASPSAAVATAAATTATNSTEQNAVIEGDIATAIAHLENMVCRVIYLPAESDPPATLHSQLHLTPNSVNIYARQMLLRDNLYVSGFTEKSDDLVTAGLPHDDDRSPDSDDELEGVEIKSSTSSISIINEIITNTLKENGDESSSSTDSSTGSSASDGIFILNYKYTHTLSHFLFHMPELLQRAGLMLCIVPTLSEESQRLPASFGSMTIVVPKSLRYGGHYCIVNLQLQDDSNRWMVDSVENHTL